MLSKIGGGEGETSATVQSSVASSLPNTLSPHLQNYGEGREIEVDI